jgi:hypothetical protein
MIELEYLPVDSLKPYDNNARGHSDKDIAAIVASIKEFGFDDPIGVWSKDNLIVEGHGRLLAAKKLGMEKVPVIHLDHLTDAQRRAYALAHNKTAELSSWLDEVLTEELNDLSEFDMSAFGFDDIDIDGDETADIEEESAYAQKAKIPHYEPTGENPTFDMMFDRSKTDELIAEIESAGIDDETKDFLINAAYRHTVFNYRNIAEFYAHADAEVQRLMEKSALVIIDVDDAIANGYVKLTKTIQDIIEGDEGDDD